MELTRPNGGGLVVDGYSLLAQSGQDVLHSASEAGLELLWIDPPEGVVRGNDMRQLQVPSTFMLLLWHDERERVDATWSLCYD
jgi:hypothetical protein